MGHCLIEREREGGGDGEDRGDGEGGEMAEIGGWA